MSESPGESALAREKLAIVDRVCDLIAGGMTGTRACKQSGITLANLHYWLLKSPVASEKYSRARQLGADAAADGVIDIAEDVDVPVDRARLIADARKWHASKVNPHQYGDRIDLTVSHRVDPKVVAEARERGMLRPISDQSAPLTLQALERAGTFQVDPTDCESVDPSDAAESVDPFG